MRRVKGEAEVIVRLDYLDGLAHITVSAWPALAAKMEKRYGPSLDGRSGQSRRWRVPFKLISFRNVPRQRKERLKVAGFASGPRQNHMSPHLAAFNEASHVGTP